MTKVYIICSGDAMDFQNSINEFIKDKDVVDIKYTAVLAPTRYDSSGRISNYNTYDRCLIIYKEKENE